MNQPRKSNNFFWGIILILLGALFLLQNLDYLDFGDVIARYWPVFIILLGIQLLWRYRQKPYRVTDNLGDQKFDAAGSHRTDRSDQPGPNYTINNVMGDIRQNFDDHDIQQFFSSNVMGNTFLNFSNARFQESAFMKINSVFGDVDIRIPDNLILEIKSNFIAGSSQIFDTYESGIFKNSYFKSPTGDDKKKKLTIEISIVFGDILIRN
jgi:predicted membrane protein